MFLRLGWARLDLLSSRSNLLALTGELSDASAAVAAIRDPSHRRNDSEQFAKERLDLFGTMHSCTYFPPPHEYICAIDLVRHEVAPLSRR